MAGAQLWRLCAGESTAVAACAEPCIVLAGGASMSVTLPPHVEAMIRERVASGRYDDASAVVEEAMRRLEEHERLEHLRALLEVGRQAELRGDLVKFTPELFEEIDRRVEEMFLRGEEPDPDVCP
jgi:putative addiction module CopG family antidote